MNLIAGLLMPNGRADANCARARSFTVSWLRWGYAGEIIEASSIDAILGRAVESGCDYCLIQSAGIVIDERAAIQGGRNESFFDALEAWTRQHEFFVLAWRNRCFLVDLKKYRERGNPPFASGGPGTDAFPQELARFLVDLGADLSGDAAFLQSVERVAADGERGVFVLNFESYDDIEQTPPCFRPPVSVLYSVSAGLKPNRILQTHGFDDRTRVVYFDYSSEGLQFRRMLQGDWDGRRYPEFLRSVFDRMPAPEAHYFLWPGAAPPPHIDWHEMHRLWAAEIERWGGEDRIAEHWVRYRALDHEFVRCNILTGHDELLEQICPGDGSVIWWSNAFSTIFSAWHYSLEEKRRMYEHWIEKLADRAPGTLLYGSDHSNSPINGITASDYLERYRAAGGDPLLERRLYRRSMRF